MRCAYAICIMAVYWVSEVTPLAVTSLLPLVIFPMLGVLEGKDVCMMYMKVIIFDLFLSFLLFYTDFHHEVFENNNYYEVQISL